MKRVFLDIVGLIATWDEADQWHDVASAALAALDADEAELLTTALVLYECGNAGSRKPFRNAVVRLWNSLADDQRLIVPPGVDIAMAWEAFRRGEASDAGIVDHVSFVVMRRLGITDAFTNDRHFEAAGFNTLF
jgi:predicted nucleic acid-binding protein